MAWKQQTDWTLGILRTSYVSCGLFMTFSNFTHRVSDGYFLILSIENIMSFLPARLICWLFHGSIRTTRDTEKSLELKQIKAAGFFLIWTINIPEIIINQGKRLIVKGNLRTI